MLDFRHFRAEQFHHEHRCRARQQNGRATQRQVHFSDDGANAVTRAEVFLRDHFAALQTAFDPAAFNDQVALVHALDRADKNLFAARHEVVEQHLALGIADFLQNDLLGGHGTDTADRHAFNRLFDEVTHLDVFDFIAGICQQLFGIGVLQASLIGHDQPAAKGFVAAAVTIDHDTHVDIARIELLAGRGQCKLDSAEHNIALNVLFARNRVDQHQEFTVHFCGLPFFLLPSNTFKQSRSGGRAVIGCCGRWHR